MEANRRTTNSKSLAELAAAVGAPNPLESDVYELLQEMIGARRTYVEGLAPITVTGLGSLDNPYVVSLGEALAATELTSPKITALAAKKSHHRDHNLLVSLLPDGHYVPATVPADVVGAINKRCGECKLIYVGSVVVVDDGTGVVGSHVTINVQDPGTVTAAPQGWIVLERLSGNLVRIRLV